MRFKFCQIFIYLPICVQKNAIDYTQLCCPAKMRSAGNRAKKLIYNLEIKYYRVTS